MVYSSDTTAICPTFLFIKDDNIILFPFIVTFNLVEYAPNKLTPVNTYIIEAKWLAFFFHLA